ncbi:MAG: hypothetical protein OJF58_004809 [Enhydrobacter sp.]|nr:MAG: hypothetical protein OJF58_004809 [Enhydrobacter sp.]
MASPEASVARPDLLARFDPESTQELRGQPVASVVGTAFRPIRVGPGGIPDPLQLHNSSLQVGVV